MRVAVILNGGGWKVAYAAGVVSFLGSIHPPPQFHVYAASAGVWAGILLLGGFKHRAQLFSQLANAVSCKGAFVSDSWTTTLKQTKCISDQTAQKCSGNLFVSLTHLSSLQTCSMSRFKSRIHLIECAWAATCVPFVTSRHIGIKINSHSFVDGLIPPPFNPRMYERVISVNSGLCPGNCLTFNNLQLRTLFSRGFSDATSKWLEMRLKVSFPFKPSFFTKIKMYCHLLLEVIVYFVKNFYNESTTCFI